MKPEVYCPFCLSPLIINKHSQLAYCTTAVNCDYEFDFGVTNGHEPYTPEQRSKTLYIRALTQAYGVLQIAALQINNTVKDSELKDTLDKLALILKKEKSCQTMTS